MIGKKTLRDVKRELVELLEKLPENPRAWLKHEIQEAEGQPGRDVGTLKMLQAALKDGARKKKKPAKRKARR